MALSEVNSAVRFFLGRGLLDCLPLHLRTATIDDESRLLKWRNDPQDREASFSTEPVEAAEHREWLWQALADPGQLFLIIEVGHSEGGRDACGMVRLRGITGPTIEISLGVAREYRRHGLGGRILHMATLVAFSLDGAQHVLAAVKPDNEASLKMFKRAGYREVGRNGQAVYMRIDRPEK